MESLGKKLMLGGSVAAMVAAISAGANAQDQQAENVEKAYGMANTAYVNGVRQHELSQASFRDFGVMSERELEGLR